MRRMVVVVVVASGCRSLLGFEEPQPLDRDASVEDATLDAAPDAPPDGPTSLVCPPTPPNCTKFTCPGSNNCYFDCQKKRRDNAATECMAVGGCLATINDSTENTCINTNAMPTFPDMIWFGYAQAPGSVEPAGGWAFDCGTSAFIAGNWGQFEPNNQGGSENCGAMTTDGSWIDANCADSLRYVCEVDVVD